MTRLTKEQEIAIMRGLARRRQKQDLARIKRMDIFARQKVDNLQNQLNTLEASPFYTGPNEKTQKDMIKQIKGELSRTLGDIVPTRAPPIYR